MLHDVCCSSLNRTPVLGVCFANFPSIGIESAAMRLLEAKGLRTVESVISSASQKQNSRRSPSTSSYHSRHIGQTNSHRRWLLESAAQSQLLDHNHLLARNTFDQGGESNIDLSETIHRAKAGAKPLLGYFFILLNPRRLSTKLASNPSSSYIESLVLTGGQKKKKNRTRPFDLRVKYFQRRQL